MSSCRWPEPLPKACLDADLLISHGITERKEFDSAVLQEASMGSVKYIRIDCDCDLSHFATRGSSHEGHS